MRFLRITERAARVLLAATLALALTGLSPAPAQAAPNPVDLELGGEGATPWVISGIKPGDSGAKTVELRNVGTVDGDVTIWFDEIVSGEGLNPESETGDTGDPGELADYLVLNVTAAGLDTNLSLPATINDLPGSFASPDYIKVSPLRAGETVNLEWRWKLPIDTDNVVQGDSITFTTTYLLQESDIIDDDPPPPLPVIVVGPGKPKDTDDTPVGPARFIELDLLGQSFSAGIDADGALIEPLTVTDGSRDFAIDLVAGTVISGPEGIELSRIELSIDAGDSVADLAIPDDLAVLSPVYRVTGYDGDEPVGRIDFAPAARLSIRYDPDALPEYVFLPYVARYDGASGPQQLPPAPGVVEVGIATGLADHASLFVVLARLAPPPPDLPEEFEVTAVVIEPATPVLEAGDLALASREIQAGESVNVSLTITNRSSLEGTTELYLVIDGVVRMVREVTLPAETSQVVTFEVHDLAAGIHQVKVAGLTEQFEVVVAGAPPIEAGVNWLVIDLSVAAVILVGAFFLYRFTRRARRV